LSRWPDTRVERRTLDDPWLTVVLAGRVEARRDGDVVSAGSGEVVLLPAGTPLELVFETDATTGEYRGLEIEIATETLARWLPLELLVALAVEIHEDAAARDVARARLDPTLPLRRLVRSRPGRRWSLSCTAKELGVSTATLRRQLSHERTGFRRVVQEERIRVAMLLLRRGPLSVGEVARRCGYRSQSKFARVFKKAVGMAPSSYRRAD
jgi:AraC-like DNA-binding protein